MGIEYVLVTKDDVNFAICTPSKSFFSDTGMLPCWYRHFQHTSYVLGVNVEYCFPISPQILEPPYNPQHFIGFFDHVGSIGTLNQISRLIQATFCQRPIQSHFLSYSFQGENQLMYMG